MQVRMPEMNIVPSSYEGKNGIGFNTTIFEPVQYLVRFSDEAMMPVEQMKAVMQSAAEKNEEVHIKFKQGQTKFGAYLEIYDVKPVSKSQPVKP